MFFSITSGQRMDAGILNKGMSIGAEELAASTIVLGGAVHRDGCVFFSVSSDSRMGALG